jgi:hypothetical protein
MQEQHVQGAGKPREPWEQQPGEPDRWYGRFQIFLNLRPTRRVLQTCRKLRNLPPAHIASAPSTDLEYQGNRTVLVCTGPDSELLLDLAALRAVRAATGLRFQRLLNATRSKLSESLRRQRSLGHPVEYMHMSLHATAEGLELADGVVDGNWLSERLAGVRVLLLASCESDSIGDWLGVVPYVITLAECIAHEDAAALTQHFWHGIGLGKEPGEALDEALTRCPPAVGEYVVRHW